MENEQTTAGELTYKHLGRVVRVPGKMTGRLLSVTHVAVGDEPGVHLVLGAIHDHGWCVAVSCEPDDQVELIPS